jgi:hypothetical protein
MERIRNDGGKSKFEHARDHYLKSFPSRMCAAVRAFAKKKDRPAPSLTELTEFAELLDVHEALSEPVAVRFRLKAKGGCRKIIKMGIGRMAQQFIVRDLLVAAGVDSEFDYTRPGAGGEKALIGAVCEGSRLTDR